MNIGSLLKVLSESLQPAQYNGTLLDVWLEIQRYDRVLRRPMIYTTNALSMNFIHLPAPRISQIQLLYVFAGCTAALDSSGNTIYTSCIPGVDQFAAMGEYLYA